VQLNYAKPVYKVRNVSHLQIFFRSPDHVTFNVGLLTHGVELFCSVTAENKPHLHGPYFNVDFDIFVNVNY